MNVMGTMATDPPWLLVGALVLVILLQVWRRSAGAAASVLWTLTLGAVGFRALLQGQDIRFLGIALPLWVFASFVLSIAGYHTWVLYRTWRMWRRTRRARQLDSAIT